MAMTEEYYPEALKELMEYFRRLPGIGRRGAERWAMLHANDKSSPS